MLFELHVTDHSHFACTKACMSHHTHNSVCQRNAFNTINFINTVESRNYAPLLCMLALGKTGEGAYSQDSDIYT